ncbi:hypothetical protein ARMSODRAFT_982556 [Armillaria solidipes]|uniref:Uncharacterized protein n=1 Tax=Armillaria solidipes TaxID=1076256 RepID=A0A2H3BAL9_9AGAR|nr:hypothetical protein ARMSODRAFT_982556 [Armillaria solidipes]
MAPTTTLHIIPGTSKASPHFTEGTVSLTLYEDYSKHCHIYLREYHEKVTEDAVISKIISGLECKNICNAYLLNQTSYDSITLSNFLNTLWTHSFGSIWALDQAQRVKVMKQNGLPSKQWFVNMFTASYILTGLFEEIKDAKLITFLINTMDAGLHTLLITEMHELLNKIKASTAKVVDGETFAK